MLKEGVKMMGFNHPNVLNLTGICVDGGPAPYIVMPFMAKGSVLSFLRKERKSLLLKNGTDEEQVELTSQRWFLIG